MEILMAPVFSIINLAGFFMGYWGIDPVYVALGLIGSLSIFLVWKYCK